MHKTSCPTKIWATHSTKLDKLFQSLTKNYTFNYSITLYKKYYKQFHTIFK